MQQLAARDVRVSIEGPAIVAHHLTPAALREAEQPIDAIALAASVETRSRKKGDWALDDATLCATQEQITQRVKCNRRDAARAGGAVQPRQTIAYE